MPRVVLAMSGGVDSSASAVLLKRQGYDVVGLFMRTGAHGHDQPDDPPRQQEGLLLGHRRRRRPPRRRPARHSVLRARLRARVRPDHRLLRRRVRPRPHAEPVRRLQHLAEVRPALGVREAARGRLHRHRALRPRAAGPDGAELHRGVDPDKDQSYVLHGIKREVLPHLLFPVGGYTKPEIRALAREAGLGRVADKPDSVEICFVPSGDHTDVVRSRRPEVATRRRDRREGRHGARRARRHRPVHGRPAEGARRRGRAEAVRAGDRAGDEHGRRRRPEDLLADGLVASRGELARGRADRTAFACAAKIRYRHAGRRRDRSAPTADGGAEVRFAEPQPAVTPGQAVDVLRRHARPRRRVDRRGHEKADLTTETQDTEKTKRMKRCNSLLLSSHLSLCDLCASVVNLFFRPSRE